MVKVLITTYNDAVTQATLGNLPDHKWAVEVVVTQRNLDFATMETQTTEIARFTAILPGLSMRLEDGWASYLAAEKQTATMLYEQNLIEAPVLPAEIDFSFDVETAVKVA